LCACFLAHSITGEKVVDAVTKQGGVVGALVGEAMRQAREADAADVQSDMGVMDSIAAQAEEHKEEERGQGPKQEAEGEQESKTA
jgi:hypothetical protein